MTAIKFAHIVLPLSLALALAACASSPSSSSTASLTPLSSAPKAETAQDSAAVQPPTQTLNFSGEQNNSFNFLNWDLTDTAKAAKMHYQRFPSFSRNYEYYALTTAIMSLLTSVTLATISVIWLLGYF